MAVILLLYFVEVTVRSRWVHCMSLLGFNLTSTFPFYFSPSREIFTCICSMQFVYVQINRIYKSLKIQKLWVLLFDRKKYTHISVIYVSHKTKPLNAFVLRVWQAAHLEGETFCTLACWIVSACKTWNKEENQSRLHIERLCSQREPQTGRLVAEEEDRAVSRNTPKTQVVVLPSDYAEKGNQNTSSFRQEDHGWQGGGWTRWGGKRGRGKRERKSHKGWQILLSRAEGANSRALAGWCKVTLGGEAGKENWTGGTERQNIKAIRRRRMVGKGAGGWKEIEGKRKKYQKNK